MSTEPTADERKAAWQAYDAAARDGADFETTVDAAITAAWRAGRKSVHGELIDFLAQEHRDWRASRTAAVEPTTGGTR